ncbi:MAG TPA: O-antigen ligase family protein [Actinomycetaceae bacterium]|nr:O-antigen ligase family protein [Actinomycetaceae bacterium]
MRGSGEQGTGRPPDWQALVLAGIAAWSVLAPYYPLRYGGAVALLLALTRMRWYRPGLSDALAFAYFTLAAASYFWADFPADTFEAIKNQLGVLGLFVGIRAVGTARINLRVIGLGYLAGCYYSLLLLWQVRRQAAPVLERGINDYRYGIVGVNQNYTAYALAVGAAVILLLWWSSGLRLRSLLNSGALLLVGVGLLAFGISLTGTRGAMLALVLLVVWGVIYRIRPETAFNTLVITGVITVILISSGLVDELITPQSEAGRETGDLNGRLTIWPYARQSISEHPLLGIGLGAFFRITPFQMVAHNLVLEIGVGVGLIGLLLFGSLMYSAVIRDTRMIEDVRGRALAVGALIAVTLPIYTSGHWEQSAAGWVVIALFSRSPLLMDTAEFKDDEVCVSPDAVSEPSRNRSDRSG